MKNFVFYFVITLSLFSCQRNQKVDDNSSQIEDVNQVYFKELVDDKLTIKPNYQSTDVYFYQGQLYNGVAFEYNGDFNSKTKYYFTDGLINKTEQYLNNKMVLEYNYYWKLGYDNIYHREGQPKNNNYSQPVQDTAYVGGSQSTYK